MNRTSLIILIVILIVFTTLTKNSTKNLEDDLFTKKENIRILNKEVSDLLLEYNYLSSAEKLMKFHKEYFQEELSQKNLKDFEIIKLKNQDEKK